MSSGIISMTGGGGSLTRSLFNTTPHYRNEGFWWLMYGAGHEGGGGQRKTKARQSFDASSSCDGEAVCRKTPTRPRTQHLQTSNRSTDVERKIQKGKKNENPYIRTKASQETLQVEN